MTLSTNRIAVVTAGIGMVLMLLTVVWRVNPVEGSVMPDFLTGNAFGQAVMFVLLVTCMPVWVVAVVSVAALSWVFGLPESVGWILGNGAAIFLQGIVYYMLGRLISISTARFRGGE
jgi:hypothetical protein